MEITRRWFLIGTSAAIAAAALPFATKLPASVEYRKREVHELFIAFQDSYKLRDSVAVIDVFTGTRDTPTIHFAMNVRGMMRWHAPMGEEMRFLRDQPMRIATQSEIGVGLIELCAHDYLEDDPYPIERWERHTFTPRGPANVEQLPLHADNSFKARKERHDLRVQRAKEHAAELAEYYAQRDAEAKRVAKSPSDWYDDDI